MTRTWFLATLAYMAPACMTLAAPATAQTAQDDARFTRAQERFSHELTIYQQEFDRYQQARHRGRGLPSYDTGTGDRDEGAYDAVRYYRSGSTYHERVLAADDRVYGGSNGRYYCKRNDGTTGLIVGAGAGGVAGVVIERGHSRTVGSLLEADPAGSEVRCR